MNLFLRGNRAVCPSCSGLVIGRGNLYSCVDCGSVYAQADTGRVDAEIIVEPAKEDN